MTFSSFINNLISVVGSSLTAARAIDITNQQLNIICAEAPGLLRTTPDPFLATTDGVYSYVASTSLYTDNAGVQGSLVGDIRDCGEVYSYVNNSYRIRYQGYGNYSPYAPQVGPNSDPMVKYPVSIVRSKRPNATDCTIVFDSHVNPGTTTAVYKVPSFLWPSQITTMSTTSHISLPEEYIMTLLLWKVLSFLGVQQYGAFSDITTMAEMKLAEARSWGTTQVSVKGKKRPLRDI